jgi:hypothetical protein
LGSGPPFPQSRQLTFRVRKTPEASSTGRDGLGTIDFDPGPQLDASGIQTDRLKCINPQPLNFLRVCEGRGCGFGDGCEIFWHEQISCSVRGRTERDNECVVLGDLPPP